jgi:hypothetical protein
MFLPSCFAPKWPPFFLAEYVALPNPHLIHFDPDDGGSMFLRNLGIHIQDFQNAATSPKTAV